MPIGSNAFRENNDTKYSSLFKVLGDAAMQAIAGKGKERHSHGENFEDQKICQLTRWGCNFANGQACKKAIESNRLRETDRQAAIAELRGAINYLAADILILEEEIKNGE